MQPNEGEAGSAGEGTQADLNVALQALSGRAIVDPREAEELSTIVHRLCSRSPIDFRLLESVLGLMQGIDSLEAFQVLAARTVPRLADLFDAEFQSSGPPDRQDVLLFLLKILGLYQSEAAPSRIALAARHPSWENHPLWPVLFATFDAPHPRRRDLAEALRDPLPTGLAGAAFLDLATGMARSGELVFHPFDSPAGRALLRAWLGSETRGDLAVAAAGALPYVGGPERDELLGLGLAHSSTRVRLEAAHAAARLGREEGLARLAELCLDLGTSMAARLYLQELGHEDSIPPAARHPDFEAAAHMADWLAHPLEFGRPPDELVQLDSRELLWPPSNDLRRLWLFHYRYRDLPPSSGHHDLPPAEGVGMVGSITASLRGETSPNMAPEDLYALHCCWELQVDQDPRAPSIRSIAAGRRLLGFGPP